MAVLITICQICTFHYFPFNQLLGLPDICKHDVSLEPKKTSSKLLHCFSFCFELLLYVPTFTDLRLISCCAKREIIDACILDQRLKEILQYRKCPFQVLLKKSSYPFCLLLFLLFHQHCFSSYLSGRQHFYFSTGLLYEMFLREEYVLKQEVPVVTWGH